MSDMNPYESVGQPYKDNQSSYGGGGGYNKGNYGGGNSYGGGGYNKGNYSNNKGGYNKGGYGGNSGGSNGAKPTFQRREYTEEDIRTARFPMSVVISGNENLPEAPAMIIARIVPMFEKFGFTIRSGGLNGTDEMVEKVSSKVELHLPFKGFNKKESTSQFSNEICKEFARRVEPNIDDLSKIPKAILEKNPRLLFGRYLTVPAQLVIVWSPDGCERSHEVTPRSGNAGHIVKLATSSGIPVINLNRPDAEQRIMVYLENFNVQQQTKAPTYEQSNQQPTQQPAAYQPNPQAGGYQGGGNQGNYGSNPTGGQGGYPAGNSGANYGNHHQSY